MKYGIEEGVTVTLTFVREDAPFWQIMFDREEPAVFPLDVLTAESLIKNHLDTRTTEYVTVEPGHPNYEELRLMYSTGVPDHADCSACPKYDVSKDQLVIESIKVINKNRDSMIKRAGQVSQAMGESGVNVLEGIVTLIFAMVPAALTINVQPTDIARLIMGLARNVEIGVAIPEESKEQRLN
jgi:hypothetical protein